MDFISFKEIESQVDSDVIENIKSQCYERVFSRSELTTVGKTKTGTRYRSRNIYETVFNEDKYKRIVRQYFIDHIHQKEVKPLKKESKKEQNKTTKKTPTKRKKKEIGKNITQREFFEHIFRDLFENRRGEEDKKGRRIYLKSFLFDIDKELKLINEQKVVSSVEKAIDYGKKCGYFTPSLFISHKFFTKEMLALLGVIVLDFDLDKANVVMTKEQVHKYIKKKLKVEPSMIWDTSTEGNFQACIRIKPMVGTPKSVHLYEQIVKEMIRKLGNVCDATTFEANHIFAIGRNNIRTGKYIRFYNETIHDINEFRWLLDERDKRRKKEQKVVNFKEESILRHPAIDALLTGKNIRFRDHACFTAALVLRFLGKDEIEAETYLLTNWLGNVNNERYDHKFTEREVMKCVRHAFSGKYKSFHSSWVETCTGLECNLRGYFKSTYQKTGAYVTDTKERFVEYLKKNNGVITATKQEIADIIGVTKRSLERLLPQMRKNNELQYETFLGKGKQTTYVLVEQMQLIPVIDIEEFKTTIERVEEIGYLEEIMNDFVSLRA